jgi:hypothetical protein
MESESWESIASRRIYVIWLLGYETSMEFYGDLWMSIVLFFITTHYINRILSKAEYSLICPIKLQLLLPYTHSTQDLLHRKQVGRKKDIDIRHPIHNTEVTISFIPLS